MSRNSREKVQRDFDESIVITKYMKIIDQLTRTI
jgi:hypothetical protein